MPNTFGNQDIEKVFLRQSPTRMSDHSAQECSLMILPYEAELKFHPANSVENNSHNQPTENTICSQIIS